MAWDLNNTSCINTGFTVMSNSYHKIQTKHGIAKYLRYIICCYQHGCVSCKNSTQKQKRETKRSNKAPCTCKFELQVYHYVPMGCCCVCNNTPKEHTNGSQTSLPRAADQTTIDLIEKNISTDMINISYLRYRLGVQLSLFCRNNHAILYLMKSTKKGKMKAPPRD